MNLLIYTVVFENNYCLAEYPKNNVLKSLIQDGILPKLAKMDLRTEISDEKEHRVFYLDRKEDVTVFTVAHDYTKKRIAWACCDELQNHVLMNCLPGLIKTTFNKFTDPKNDKILVLEDKVNDVQKTMIDNIDKLLEREVLFTEIINSTHDIAANGQQFRDSAVQVKRKNIIAVVASMLIFGCICVFAIICAILFVCGLLSFSKCLSPNKKLI